MTYNKTPNGCTWLPPQPKDVEEECIKHDIAYIARAGKIKADIQFFLGLWGKRRYFRAILFTSAVLVFGYYFYYHREINDIWKTIVKSQK